MEILRSRRPVHIGVLLVLILLAIIYTRVSKNNTVVNQGSFIIEISDDFSSKSINDIAVYNCDEDATEDIPPNEFDSLGKPKGFGENLNPVELRPIKNQYRCWQYMNLINPTGHTKELILTVKQTRVDELAWYLYHQGEADLQGILRKDDPLYKRTYPYYDYAIPLSVGAGDTLKVLMRSKRVSGIYEISASLITRELYEKDAQIDHTRKIVLLTVCALIVVFLLLFGLYLREPDMVYPGLFFLPIVFFISGYYGFYIRFNIFPKIALNIYNQYSFFVFLINAAFHPFGYQLVKDYLNNKNYYAYAAGIVAGINLICAAMFLFPHADARLFHEGMNHYFVILTLINLAWAGAICIVIYLRSGNLFFLLVWAIGTAPGIVRQFSHQKNALSNPNPFDQSITNPIYFLIILLLLFLFIIRSRIINKRRLEEEMIEQREKLIGQRKLEIVEIGRTLHDHIGNSLAAILGYLQSNKPSKELLIPLTLKTIGDLRVISHQLVESELKPLSIAISDLVQEFENFSDIQFQFLDNTSVNINKISLTTQNNVFHIVQELLTNIIKHSQAKEAYIQIFEEETFYQIVVEDDGIGIPKHQNSKGIGLKNIEERAQLNHLEVFTDSSAQGTSVFIKIPKSAITMTDQSIKK
jgi:signal transduction histidine kinase